MARPERMPLHLPVRLAALASALILLAACASAPPRRADNLPLDNEPVWGVTIPVSAVDEFPYALDVDGLWQADPGNPLRSPYALAELTMAPASTQIHRWDAPLFYPSHFRWPADGRPAPASVRIVSPGQAEFRYVGRIREAITLRSPLRDGDWGGDELLPLNPAAQANLGEIRANPMLGGLRGVVLDAEGQPVAGAHVRALWLQTALAPSRFAWRTGVAREDGTFEMDRLDLGPATVIAWAPGYQASQPRSMRILSKPGDAPAAEFIVTKRADVTGSVTDPDGQPVAEAFVTVRPVLDLTAPNALRIPGRPVTDAAGAFVLASLPEGFYDVVASAEGFASSAPERLAVKNGAAPATLRLMLQRGVTVRGRAVGEDSGSSTGVAGATVVAAIARDEGFQNTDQRPDIASEWRFASTDAQGNFVLRGLPAGAFVWYSASLGLRKTEDGEAQYLAEGREPPAVELRLDGGGTIAGFVRMADGSPVAGARVTPVLEREKGPKKLLNLPAYYEASQGGRLDMVGVSEKPELTDLMPVHQALPGAVPEATTQADGSFVIPGLSNTSGYRLEARMPGCAPTRSFENVWCGSSEDTVLTLGKGGSIEGRVLEEGSGRGLALVRVSLTPAEGLWFVRETLSAVTDTSGTFTMAGVGPGWYRVEAQGFSTGADGVFRRYWALASRVFDVREGETRRIDLTARPGVMHSGRVTTSSWGGDGSGALGSTVKIATVGSQPLEGAMVLNGSRYATPARYREDKEEDVIFCRASGIGPVFTGPDGYFEFEGLPGFTSFVNTYVPGYSPSTGEKWLKLDSSPIGAANTEVKLLPGINRFSYHGRAVDPDGLPVPGITLRISDPFGLLGDSCVTGEEGFFEFKRANPRSLPIRIVADTWSKPDCQWVCVRKDTSFLGNMITVNLAPAGSITGRVTDDAGHPLEGVSIRSGDAPDRMRPLSQEGDIRTNAAGEYRISGLVGGSYRVLAIKKGYGAVDKRQIEVRAGETTTGVDLKFWLHYHYVFGRVVDAKGRELSGWDVGLRDGVADGSEPVTDGRGRFTIAGWNSSSRFVLSRNGVYRQRYYYRRDQYVNGTVDSRDTSTSAPVTLVLDVSHTLHGRLVLAGSGKPVADVRVVGAKNDPAAGDNLKGTRCVPTQAFVFSRLRSDANGAFVIDHAPRGKLTLDLLVDGVLSPEHPQIEVGEAEEQDLGDIVIQELPAATN